MNSALILMSLVTTNSNAMSNSVALNYLKTQEKNKIHYFNKKQYENKRNQLFSNKNNKKHRQIFNNFDIVKEYKR